MLNSKISNQIKSNSIEQISNKSEINQVSPPQPTDIPNIEYKYSKAFYKALKRIEDRKPENLGSIFDNKKVSVRKISTLGNASFITDFKNYKKNINKDKDKYNVFSNEDNIVKELMVKFRENNIKNKIPKTKRKDMAFNRLYDITNQSKEKLIYLKKSKQNYSLEKYQEKILKAISPNSIENDEILNLIQSFNELKTEANDVKALPPINVNAIRNHIKNSNKKGMKKKNMKEIISKNEEPLDEFEKEEKLIRNIKSYHKSQPKLKRNKNLDMLPEYVKDIFTKKLNYHN